MQIPFALPDIGEGEILAVADAVKSGWLSSGLQMRVFEKDVQKYLDTENACLAVSSATAGLELVLSYLPKGGEVIIPTITFAACLNMTLKTGMVPVVADVGEDLCLPLSEVERLCTSNTVAVMMVHFSGTIPKDRQAIIDFCNARSISVIEDAAHSFGSMVNGHPVGHTNDVLAQVFSFYATKCITTGEGGMVVTSNDSLAEWVRRNRLHGMSRDAFDRYTKVGSSWEYDIVSVGLKANMPDTAAAMGRVQLSREKEMRLKRRKLEEFYTLNLTVDVRRPWTHQGHARHLYPITLPGSVDRNEFIEKMAYRGVGTSVHFKPLHRLRVHLKDVKEFPVAEAYWKSCVSLPLYSKMQIDQAQYVVESVECSL